MHPQDARCMNSFSNRSAGRGLHRIAGGRNKREVRGQREGHESQRKTVVISGSHFQPAHSDVKGTERITNFRSTTKKAFFLKRKSETPPQRWQTWTHRWQLPKSWDLAVLRSHQVREQRLDSLCRPFFLLFSFVSYFSFLLCGKHTCACAHVHTHTEYYLYLSVCICGYMHMSAVPLRGQKRESDLWSCS